MFFDTLATNQNENLFNFAVWAQLTKGTRVCLLLSVFTSFYLFYLFLPVCICFIWKFKLFSVSLVDRGNYTCRPASGGEASISLHVLEGGHQHQLDEDHQLMLISKPKTLSFNISLCTFLWQWILGWFGNRHKFTISTLHTDPPF